MGSLQSQIGRTCSVSDQQITLGFAQSMCKSVGINFDLPPGMSVSVATLTATATVTSSLGPDISASAGTTTVVDTTVAVAATTSYVWSSTPSAKPLSASNLTQNGTQISHKFTPKTTAKPSSAANCAVQWLGAVLVGMVGVTVFL